VASKLSLFLAELKRRKVTRVVVVYALVGFGVIEAAEMIFPRLQAPDWSVSLIVGLVLLGFPIALVLAWALEVTPDGIRVTDVAQGAEKGGTAPARPGMAGYTLVFALGAILSLGVWALAGWVRGGDGDAHKVRSLAVLPFTALSDDSSDRWMAQGLHDEIITELAGLEGLDKVISRTSVLQYAENPLPIPEIARELNVDAVIEGTILPSTDRVRINVQLIAGATEGHLWAQVYDRAREEALDLVKAVAQDIAVEIRLQLSAADEARLRIEQRVNPAAQEAYFRGRAFWNERTEGALERAAEQFRQAIEIDPEYGAAYAGMASLNALGAEGGLAHVEEYAREALALDPGSAEAYTAIAYVELIDEQAWDQAEEHFRTAVRLNPGYATAHAWGAELLIGRGRPLEALEWMRRARELDPFSAIIAWQELRILYVAERYDECIAANERYEAEFPEYGGFRAGNLADCLLGAGRYSEAAEVLEAPDSILEAIASGTPKEVWRWMWKGEARLDVDMFLRSLAQSGEDDRFFQAMDQVIELILECPDGAFCRNLPMLLADPLVRPMHEDPRWREIVLSRLGLSEWPG
jgi:TolB-like protein/Tfp pilus assembly protein PilF